jgi:hypothetical protein
MSTITQKFAYITGVDKMTDPFDVLYFEWEFEDPPTPLPSPNDMLCNFPPEKQPPTITITTTTTTTVTTITHQ